MRTMNNNIFFEQLLDIPGLKVDRVSYEPRKIILHCHSELEGEACPHCGSREKKAVRSQDERKVRDLDASGKEVWLHIRVRQFECDCGRYFNEPFDWALPGKSYTVRQSKFIFEMCGKQPFSAASAILNMCPKTVERVYYAHAKEAIDLKKRYGQVRKLGIDEISLRKGKGDYCCVLTDLERGIQLDILPDRKKATLVAHFERLGEDFCQQIEDVSCDMWGPYVDVAKTCFPNARITIDRFHVVKLLNDVLDSMRKSLRKEQPLEAVLKQLKWILFKRPEKLDQSQKEALDTAFELSPALEEAYVLRNSFHAIFDQSPNKQVAAQRLEQWIEDVRFTGNEKWEAFLKTLNNWKDSILNFVETHISNAVTEGLNNVIRYVRRISFAIPNFQHMRLRVLAGSS